MATDTTTGAAQVLDGWRAQGIRFVRFELPDMHGTSRSKMVPIERAYGYAESGLNMYGGVAVLDSRSDVVGGTLYHEEVAYGDQLLLPDLETAAVVPWREATARWICDSTWADGTPLEALPRRVWRKQLERARALGYEPLIGYEPEFYLLTDDQELLFEGYHIFNVTRNTYVPFIQELVEQLNAYGLRGDHGQLRVRRLAVGAAVPAAARHGRPRPLLLVQERGQGACAPARLHGHVHEQAVRRLGRVGAAHARVPAECRRRRQRVRRRVGRGRRSRPRAAASSPATCATRASIYALLAPTVNCMKRRRTHTFSPTNVSWGLEDRSALIRIKGGTTESRHIEHRAPTGLSNPYLVGAAILAAGLNGIEDGLELEPAAHPPAEEDESRTKLPTSVRESLEALEADERIAGALGDDFVTAYGVMRRHELSRFDDHVTDWERNEYVEIY